MDKKSIALNLFIRCDVCCSSSRWRNGNKGGLWNRTSGQDGLEICDYWWNTCYTKGLGIPDGPDLVVTHRASWEDSDPRYRYFFCFDYSKVRISIITFPLHEMLTFWKWYCSVSTWISIIYHKCDYGYCLSTLTTFYGQLFWWLSLRFLMSSSVTAYLHMAIFPLGTTWGCL